MEWVKVHWIHLIQERALVSRIMNLRVSYNTGNLLSNCANIRFSRWTQLRGVTWLFSAYLSIKTSEHTRRWRYISTYF
jgi:hypothetical protein